MSLLLLGVLMSKNPFENLVSEYVKLLKLNNSPFKAHFRTKVYGFTKLDLIVQAVENLGYDFGNLDFTRIQVELDKQTFVKRLKIFDVPMVNGTINPIIRIGIYASKKKLYRWVRQNHNRFLLDSEYFSMEDLRPLPKPI